MIEETVNSDTSTEDIQISRINLKNKEKKIFLMNRVN